VLGIGLNVAVTPDQLPDELRGRAATLGLGPEAIEPTLDVLLSGLERWLEAAPEEVLDAVRARDALLGRPVRWADGEGVGAGIDDEGRLLVSVTPADLTAGDTVALDAGEVHLASL